MAVTKIKAIRGTLNKALAYIMNPEKTDDKMLVSSYGCAAETAAQEFEYMMAQTKLKVSSVSLMMTNSAVFLSPSVSSSSSS